MTDLFTPEQFQQLVQNGNDDNFTKDHYPVVRLYILFTGCQWLLTELDPENPHIAFGLCDLGMGFPELGYVDLDEIKAVKTVPFPIMRDVFFEGKYPISVYADAARACQAITIEEQDLLPFIQSKKPPGLLPQ